MTRYQPMYVQDGSYAASQDRRLLNALWPNARSTGVAVTVASGMTLSIAPGSVAVPTQNNTGSTLCVSDANEQVVIPAAPPSGQSRIDMVICRPRDFDLDGSSNSDFIFDVVVGTPAASPVTPPLPPGTVCLAQVTVPGGAASLAQSNIFDTRPFALSVGSTPAALPPPMTGTNYGTFTDQSGEVWFAAGFVANGAWRRARDVLHCRVYRNAAMPITVGGGATTVVYDATIYDPCKLWNGGAWYFYCLATGIWQMTFGGTIAPTGTGCFTGHMVNAGPVGSQSNILNIGWHQGMGYGVGGVSVTQFRANAGDAVQNQLVAALGTAGSRNVQTGNAQCFACLDYLGTG